MPILSVDLSALKSDVCSGTITLTGAALKLTAAAAGALNQAFGDDRVHRGPAARHGDCAARTRPARIASARTYGATTLKLDPGAVAALTGLGVAPAPIAPATALPTGELAFPIVNPPFSALLSGTIRHTRRHLAHRGRHHGQARELRIDPLRRS